MIDKVLNFIIPQIDKLTHFYLFSIGLAACLFATTDIKAYIISFSVSVLWELYQKYIKKGTNSKLEMARDIFFGGILPSLLHFITTI